MIMIILSKDARLPVQLQRAMAAEAEAAREARAKVCGCGHGAGWTRVIITKMMIIINIATLRGCHMGFFL